MKKYLCSFISLLVLMSTLTVVLANGKSETSTISFYEYSLNGAIIDGCNKISVDTRIAPETAAVIIRDLMQNRTKDTPTVFTYPLDCPGHPNRLHDMYWYRIYYHGNDSFNDGKCVYNYRDYDKCENSGCTFSIMDDEVGLPAHTTGSSTCNNAVVPVKPGELQIVYMGH